MTTDIKYYEDRFIAFIDILGFRELIKQSESDPDIANKVHRVLTHISELKRDNDHGILSQKDLGKEVSVFSDSIVISYPVSLESAAFYLLQDIIHLQLEMMGVGILLRGGVVTGELYHNDSVVYGPAMIAAYDHESKYAIYPRVVVHQDVINVGIANGIHDPEHEHEYINGLLEKDEDHQLYIDFMYQWQEIDHEFDYFQALYTTKELIEHNINNLQNPNVLMKYNWLKRYYNRTLDKLDPKYTTGLYL